MVDVFDADRLQVPDGVLQLHVFACIRGCSLFTVTLVTATRPTTALAAGSRRALRCAVGAGDTFESVACVARKLVLVLKLRQVEQPAASVRQEVQVCNMRHVVRIDHAERHKADTTQNKQRTKHLVTHFDPHPPAMVWLDMDPVDDQEENNDAPGEYEEDVGRENKAHGCADKVDKAAEHAPGLGLSCEQIPDVGLELFALLFVHCPVPLSVWVVVLFGICAH